MGEERGLQLRHHVVEAPIERPLIVADDLRDARDRKAILETQPQDQMIGGIERRRSPSVSAAAVRDGAVVLLVNRHGIRLRRRRRVLELLFGRGTT